MSFVDAYTDFIFLEDEPQESDVIFLPGSNEGALALKGAALFKDGYAPFLLPSGRYGKLVGHFAGEGDYETEWAYFHDLLRKEGVPEQAILKEDQATYTYENAIYSRKVTDAAGLFIRRGILCCQAYHARRAKLYYQVCFPESEILVCPVVTKGISRDSWYRSEASIDLVLNEVKHCGTQFHEIFREHLASLQGRTETFSPDGKETL